MGISAVRATTCDVPLPRPIVIGEIRFDSREKLSVRNLPMGQRGIFMRALSAVDIALWLEQAAVACCAVRATSFR